MINKKELKLKSKKITMAIFLTVIILVTICTILLIHHGKNNKSSTQDNQNISQQEKDFEKIKSILADEAKMKEMEQCIITNVKNKFKNKFQNIITEEDIAKAIEIIDKQGPDSVDSLSKLVPQENAKDLVDIMIESLEDLPDEFKKVQEFIIASMMEATQKESEQNTENSKS